MHHIVTRGSLLFTWSADGSFTCNGLASAMASRFTRFQSEETIRGSVSRRLEAMGKACKSGSGGASLGERQLEGARIFEQAVREQVFPEGATLLQEFLFWASDWWQHHPMLSDGKAHFDWDAVRSIQKGMRALLFPALPDQVERAVAGMEIVSIATRGEHFAILFDDARLKIRRIVTDTQMFELHDAYGHAYLDVLESGKPFARFCSNRGGGRAFFDGSRLMSHDSFRTCAPRMQALDGEYTVDSQEVTVWGGKLGRKNPSPREGRWLGHFLPAGQQLLSTGFALCGWSEFVPYSV